MNKHDGRYLRSYLFGRNALFAAGEAAVQKGIGRIAVPAYCCGDEIAALSAAGLTVEMFDVELSEGLISTNYPEGAEAYLVPYFFGIKPLNKFENERYFTIHDRAYSFDPLLSNMGTISVYSLRKQLEVPNGAMLVSDFEIQGSNDIEAPPQVLALENDAYAEYRAGAPQGSGSHPGLDSNDPFGPRYSQWGGYGLLADIDLNQASIVNRSETLQIQFAYCLGILQNYFNKDQLWISQRMLDDKVQFPTILPVLVSDSEVFYRCATSMGFTKCIPFWRKGLSLTEMDKYPTAHRLKRQIVGLSFIHEWDDNDFQSLVKVCERVMRV